MAEYLQWVITNSAYYNTISNKKPGALYFLEDTKEIYRGAVSYTNAVELVDEFPSVAAHGRLYINSDTLEGKILVGGTLHTIMPPTVNNIVDGEDQSAPASANAIKEYVEDKIDESLRTISLNTDIIILKDDIVLNGIDLGSFKDGDTIDKDTPLTEILEGMFIKAIPATYDKPTISLSPDGIEHEAGDLIYPDLTIDYDPANAGPITLATLERNVNGTISTLYTGTAQLPFYSDTNVQVPEGSVKYTATVNYSAPNIKQNNIGENSVENRYGPGTVDASIMFTGFRKAFCGVSAVDTSEYTNSNSIRTLPKSYLNPVPGQVYTLPVQSGATMVTFAYPSGLGEISSIKSLTTGTLVTGVFGLSSVNVEGSNGYAAIPYRVYTYIPEVPFPASDVFEFII